MDEYGSVYDEVYAEARSDWFDNRYDYEGQDLAADYYADYDVDYDKACEDGTLAEHGFYEDWAGPDAEEITTHTAFVTSIPFPDYDPEDIPF